MTTQGWGPGPSGMERSPATRCPSLLNSTDSRLRLLTSALLQLSKSGRFPDRGGDPLRRRDDLVLQLLAEGDGHPLGSDPRDRGVQVQEEVLGGPTCHLDSPPSELDRLVNDRQTG